MSWWEAIILGLIEGLTEYLPVSSTGHLILAQRAMGLTGRAANAYAICIQAGAILAVLGLYRGRVKQGLRGIRGAVKLGEPDPAGFNLFRNLVVAFMPAAVFGLMLDDWIEAKLFGLWPIVTAWFVGGVAILLVSWRRKETATLKDDALAEGESAVPVKVGKSVDDMHWRMALAIGLIQCIAMWPGTSRSLVTIVGGVLIGLSLASAVEFSFLLGVVTLCAATVYKAKDAGPEMVEAYGWFPMILGSIAAYISAVAAVTWMVAYLKKHGMSLFGYWRIGIAVVVAILILTNVLSTSV